MAADLAVLLEAAGLTGPYVLAGHSFGGIIARRFLAAYPGRTAGMLLIDSSHEGQAGRLPAPGWRGAAASRLGRLRGWQALLPGGQRLAGAAGLPGPGTRAGAGLPAPARHRQAAARETALLDGLRGTPPDLETLPLTVLTSAARPWPGYPQWALLQAELAAMSRDSRHVLARHGGHHIHRDDPALVITELSVLLRRVREG